MEFLFHSVYQKEDQNSKYFNVYRVNDNRFFAECHHFNLKRVCDSDFEIMRQGDEWKSSKPEFQPEAEFIGEELSHHFSMHSEAAG